MCHYLLVFLASVKSKRDEGEEEGEEEREGEQGRKEGENVQVHSPTIVQWNLFDRFRAGRWSHTHFKLDVYPIVSRLRSNIE